MGGVLLFDRKRREKGATREAFETGFEVLDNFFEKAVSKIFVDLINLIHFCKIKTVL